MEKCLYDKIVDEIVDTTGRNAQGASIILNSFLNAFAATILRWFFTEIKDTGNEELIYYIKYILDQYSFRKATKTSNSHITLNTKRGKELKNFLLQYLLDEVITMDELVKAITVDKQAYSYEIQLERAEQRRRQDRLSNPSKTRRGCNEPVIYL